MAEETTKTVWRAFGKNVIVRLDPLLTEIRSILIPDGAYVRTGTVCSVGKGKSTRVGRHPLGLSEGDRVAFMRWHTEHQTGKRLVHTLSDGSDEELAILEEEDVLFVFTGNPEIYT